jgi:hypothetical protein
VGAPGLPFRFVGEAVRLPGAREAGALPAEPCGALVAAALRPRAPRVRAVVDEDVAGARLVRQRLPKRALRIEQMFDTLSAWS